MGRLCVFGEQDDRTARIKDRRNTPCDKPRVEAESMHQVSDVVARRDHGIPQRDHQARPMRREPILSLSQSTSQPYYAVVF